MELRQLRAFVEVADFGHFGHAAEHLHLTQPALTQRIQALERDLGLHLLERNARGRSMPPAPFVEFGIAYRRDDQSPLLANLLRTVDERVLTASSYDPEDGEPI